MDDQQSGTAANNHPPIIPLLPWCVTKIKCKLHDRRARKEKETPQDRSSRRTATATIWIAIFAVAAAVVGGSQAFIANRQLSAMQGQLDAMEIDKRPWLKVSVTIAKLQFTEWAGNKGIFASLAFDLKNYGESPAINIRNWTDIHPHPGNDKRAELDTRQKDTCDGVRAQADQNPIGGIAIFPTETDQIQSGTGTFGLYETDAPIIFSVLGCIDYTYAHTRHGQTGFRMILGRIIKNRIESLPFVQGSPRPYEEPIPPELLASGYPASPPKVAVVPPSDFVFRPDEGGSYAK